ncbi:MAG: F0F1 ATP synthase subunit epsilon [Calditrichaeota bacterium]|nr:F0F1 ATP synthase subunit epsilon [Calditrichota bacterium]
MARTYKLEVITPEGRVYDSEVVHLRAPGVEGDFGILADHAPIMAAVRIGRLHVDEPNASFDFCVSGGYLEGHDNRMVLLAETCERKENIDVERARRDRDRALKRLREATNETDIERARAALMRALNRLRVAES